MDNKQRRESLKSKALSTAGLIIEKSLLVKDAAQEKTRIVTQKAKLHASINKNKAKLKELYSDLGSMYYLMFKDNPDDMMRQTCEEITLLLEQNNNFQETLNCLEVAESPLNEDPEEEISVEIYNIESSNAENSQTTNAAGRQSTATND